MLTDRQSIFLCTLSVVSFVVFGILNMLHELYISIPIIVIFSIIVINLLITKREKGNLDNSESNNNNNTSIE